MNLAPNVTCEVRFENGTRGLISHQIRQSIAWWLDLLLSLSTSFKNDFSKIYTTNSCSPGICVCFALLLGWVPIEDLENHHNKYPGFLSNLKSGWWTTHPHLCGGSFWTPLNSYHCVSLRKTFRSWETSKQTTDSLAFARSGAFACRWAPPALESTFVGMSATTSSGISSCCFCAPTFELRSGSAGCAGGLRGRGTRAGGGFFPVFFWARGKGETGRLSQLGLGFKAGRLAFIGGKTRLVQG